MKKTVKALLLLFLCLILSGCAKKERPRITGISDLNDPEYTIGVMTGVIAAKEARNRFPKAVFMEYPMPIDAFTALSAGKIDVFVLDRPTLEYMSLAHPELVVLKEDLAVGHISTAVSKDNVQLNRRVNGFIRKYRSDGTYRQMFDRWFHTAAPKMPELPRAQKPDGVLKVGITANNEPVCFIKNGKLSGFDTEFSLRLAHFLNLKIEFKDMPYDVLVAALSSGKIDIAIAQMDADPEREESVLFSEEYIDSPITAIIHRKLIVPADRKISDSSICKTVRSLRESFNKTFIREDRWKLILQGLCTTIVITVFATILGTVLAFPICKMCRSKRKLISWLGERYVSLIMGTPILVILMILYYVIFAKVDINGIIVAILAFALDFSAYASVMLRSGIDGIPRGQMEAALSLGHPPAAAFLRFILPQAIRSVLPVYRGEIISTLKSTSIVGYIAIMDLTKMGDIIRSRTYEAFFPLLAIALIYFLAAKCMTELLQIVEKRTSPENRRNRLLKKGKK